MWTGHVSSPVKPHFARTTGPGRTQKGFPRWNAPSFCAAATSIAEIWFSPFPLFGSELSVSHFSDQQAVGLWHSAFTVMTATKQHTVQPLFERWRCAKLKVFARWANCQNRSSIATVANVLSDGKKREGLSGGPVLLPRLTPRQAKSLC